MHPDRRHSRLTQVTPIVFWFVHRGGNSHRILNPANLGILGGWSTDIGCIELMPVCWQDDL